MRRDAKEQYSTVWQAPGVVIQRPTRTWRERSGTFICYINHALARDRQHALATTLLTVRSGSTRDQPRKDTSYEEADRQ